MAVKTEQLQIRVSAAEKRAIRRLARGAGVDVSSYVLSRLLPPVRQQVDEIVRVLRGKPSERRAALAALNDLLTALVPSQWPDATAALRVNGLAPWLQNYVAAMVEQAAAHKGVIPPAWVADVEPLDEPHFAVSFPQLRLHLLRAAPVTFKRRNLFVDAAVGDRV